MSIGDANCLDRDYRFEYTYNDKNQITGARAIFSKKFLRERNRQYDPKSNKYIKKNDPYGGID